MLMDKVFAREILIKLGELPDGSLDNNYDAEGFAKELGIGEDNQSKERYGYHCLLLSQAGLIICSGEGIKRENLRNYYPMLLTYEGQMYLQDILDSRQGLPF